MSDTQKIIIAIVGVFAVGFLMVGANKEQSSEQKEAAAMIRAVSGMQNMAHQKCPALIKKFTGTAVTTLVKSSESDRATYVTLTWNGDKGDNFKKAVCTLTTTLGGVSKLVIDGKVVVDKE